MALRHNKCKHFNGGMNDCCKVGINYEELAGEPQLGMALRLPCLGDYWHNNPKFDPASVVSCERFETPNQEEIEAQEAKTRQTMRRIAKLTSDGDEHRLFMCCMCEDEPVFEGQPFVEHLKTVHERTSTVMQVDMSSHMDATNWFQNVDKLSDAETGALIGYRSIRTPRRGVDKALWGSGKKRKK